MIHIPTVMEFWERTAILIDYEFEDVDIVPSTLYGFQPYRLEELIEFCAKNPDYHIISIVNGFLYFNKVMENASEYRLGQGDSNPDLVCLEKYRLPQFIDSLIKRKTKGVA